jgi:hypothetical protein
MSHKTGYKTVGLKQYTQRKLSAIGKEGPQSQITALAGYEKEHFSFK